MKVLVTGANGFVATNLMVKLDELGSFETLRFDRTHSLSKLNSLVAQADAIVHLAGVNRTDTEHEFFDGNTNLTQDLLAATSSVIKSQQRYIPIIYSSSIQACRDNAYGKSKLAAEKLLCDFAAKTGSPVYILRLPNVFGKWCRPNYNSMVATFCHNIARDLPIEIHDENANVKLVYIDDVVEQFIDILKSNQHFDQKATGFSEAKYVDVERAYDTTVGEVAAQLRAFKFSRENLISERVGKSFTRKLYSTYVSYFSSEHFAYDIPQHRDHRGVFVEMLKTKDSGQFSFFTASPGITRGGHYHHTKSEKFLVIKGQAKFRFRHILSGEYYELTTTGEHSKIVETVPGWTHDITNVGDEELIVMLWANEIFDRERPDTYASLIDEKN